MPRVRSLDDRKESRLLQAANKERQKERSIDIVLQHNCLLFHPCRRWTSVAETADPIVSVAQCFWQQSKKRWRKTHSVNTQLSLFLCTAIFASTKMLISTTIVFRILTFLTPPSPIHFPSLSTDGVLVAKKDFEIQHDELATKNLYVIKAMQSLTSKGFVKTQFSWQYYYYTLTDEGLDFLREFLGVPEGIVPQTLMEQPIPQRQQNFRREGGRRFDGDNGYRKRNRD